MVRQVQPPGSGYSARGSGQPLGHGCAHPSAWQEASLLWHGVASAGGKPGSPRLRPDFRGQRLKVPWAPL